MADRSVVVRLKAEVSGFQAAMAASGASAKSMQADLEQMQQNGGTALGRLATSAEQHKQAWESSGVAMLGFGAAAMAGIGIAVKAYADFGAEMAQVQSLSHASASEMAILTDAALNMGQNIGFSATEVADAEIELVKAGVSVKDIMGGALVGSLTLAAAGQISVADATEIATIAMTQFHLAGSDIPHVADLLAAGADKALGGVQELGWALKTGGLVAHQFGLSLDDTVGTLALFAQNGLMGETAGTDLRQMLLKLAAPSQTASDDMAKLGMVLYDSKGHFVGITSLAGQLQEKMGKLSEAERNAMEAHIFGARSIIGANILYQAGAKGVQGWIAAVNDSGFAAKQAAGKMDSMNGDLKKLEAAWQSSLIEMGSTSDSFVRPIIQGATQIIQQFEALPQSLKGTILGFGAVVGVAALLGGTFLTIVPKILDIRNGFKQLQTDGSRVAGTFGSIAKYATVAGAAIAAANLAATMMTAGDTQAQSIDASAQALLNLSKAGSQTNQVFGQGFFKNANGFQIGGFEKDITGVGDALHKLNNPSLYDHINDFASSILPAGDYQMKEVRKSITNIDSAMANFANSGSMTVAAKGFQQVAAAGAQQGVTLKQTAASFPQYMDALRAQATAAKVTVSDQDLLNWAMGKVPAAMQAATSATQTYTDLTGVAQPLTSEMTKALDKLGLSADGTAYNLGLLTTSMEQTGLLSISADSAAIAYHKALDDLTASVAKNGRTLNINTDAGRSNKTALDAIASSGLALVNANAKNGDSQQSLTQNLHTTYDALVKGAGQFGITGAAADTLARKALGIPKGIKIDSAITNYIQTQLEMLNISRTADAVNGKTIDLWVNTHNNTIYSDTHVSNGVGGSGGQTRSEGGPIYRASGGPIGAQYLATGGHSFGPIGTDTVPAWLTPGEFVVKRSSAQALGSPALNYMNSTGRLPSAGSSPAYQSAPSYQAAASPAHSVTTIYVTGQSNPVATAHEVTRRQTALAV